MQQPSATRSVADAVGCVTHLYQLVGTTYGSLVYAYFGLQFLLSGDLCGLVTWVFLLGPLVSAAGGALWPLAIFVWPFPGGF